MIKFPCRCKHVFELDEDMAGKQIQCPDCQRLIDVPTHQELLELAADGTFQMERPVAPDPHTFEKMRRIYGKEKVDELGQEIDIRQTYADLAAAGTDENSIDFDSHPTAPKYDPVTGELVRPLEIRESDRPEIANAIPFANAALSYATPELHQKISMVSPLLELLMPINLVTMFFVLVAHFFLTISFLTFISAFLALCTIGLGLIAHYANVIEEVGVEQRDELPRFLRHFNIADDIWFPALRVLLAVLLCSAPSRMLRYFLSNSGSISIPGFLAVVALDLVGLTFFPAVLLTAVTSGSISNLRPDRVVGTMAKIGWRYALLTILFAGTTALYSFGMAATALHAASIITWVRLPWFLSGAVSYGALMVAIYLMHYFTWTLGICYRSHHHEFPWVFQYHVREIPGVNAPRHAPLARPPHAQE